MEIYNRYTQQHNSLHNAYVACASTGKAAVSIGGTTVHSTFRLTQSRKTSVLPTELLHSYRNLFIGVKCIIIDEVSMISADILHRINQRLQQITGVYDQLFGGMNIILCGDFRQLPPVNATPVFKMPRNVFAGVVLWQSLNYFPLLRVVRQFDETFSSILTKIGNGETLTDDENILIEGRFRTVEWCNENLPNAVRLYHRNIDVDAYNRTAIVDPVRCVTRDRFFGYTTVTEKNECRRKLHKMSVAEYDGLPYMIALATDYPYMITINIDVEDGLVNGAIGVLKYIETLEDEDCNVDDDEPQPSTSGGSDTIEHIVNIRLWIDFANVQIGRKARLKC
ncbi:ATP-dependent DNA helicase PIF1 [Ooceraea biroi]|uniref:ATP-dependent DNA helicase n=1 Tax=Ooceraea biroi TaxID=2015173 RepID=A0A026VRL8_OOCBI|nr:ATP-dependent DNA helicase PIF1 [Ooceraea biroi]